MRASIATTLAAAVLAACSYATPQFAIKHSEQHRRLERNGLRFIIMPDASANLVEVAVRYDVGARDDPPGKAGLAHLVEHVMFEIHPGGLPQPLTYYINQLSPQWNAYTTFDSTHYMTLGNRAQLELLLQIEAARLADRCTTLSEVEFEREREVVRNEIRERGGTPEDQIAPLLAATLYPAGHPSARMIGGDDQQIASLTRADACAFIDEHYVPERATLVIAGDVDVDATTAMVARSFAGLERRASGRAPVSIAPVELSTERTTYDLDIERPVVAVSWALPPTRGAAGDAVVSEIRGRLGRITGPAQTYGFATSASTIAFGGREAPVISLLIELTEIGKLDTALDFAWKVARRDKTAVDKDTWAQPVQTKSRLKASFLISLEPLQARARAVADLVQFTPDIDFLSPRPYVFHALDEIEALDLDGVEAEARRILDPARARVTLFRPNRAGIKGDRQAAFALQAQPHDFGTPDVDPADAGKRLAIPRAEEAVAAASRFELSNGLRIVLLPRPSAAIPVVTAQLIVGAGDAAAPDSPLLADAAARFVIPPPDVRMKLALAGIRIGWQTTADHTICSLQAISLYLPEMVEGLARMLKAGEYDEESLERWQKDTGDLGKRRRRLARDEFERQILGASFGADHPYTRSGVRPPGAEQAIHRDALMAFRNTHYGAANMTLVVVGAFDPASVTEMIHDAFDRWPRGHTDPAAPVASRARDGAKPIGVVRDEGPQMEVAISYPAPPGIDGQEAARLVIVEMLAEQASDVRTQLGATYGVQVRREPRRGPSRYEIAASVDATRAGEALQALRDSIEALCKGDGFDVVFVRARRKVANRLLDESAASRELAQRLVTIARFDLPPDYYQRLTQQVAAMSRAQIKALIATELALERESIVVTADRATMTAAFAAAGITDYQLVEPSYDARATGDARPN